MENKSTAKFEEVREECIKHKNTDTNLPSRSTLHSAGYDFKSKEDVMLSPGESHVFWTDVKIKLPSNLCLKIYTRSGNGIKGIQLKNQVGIIDSDYYSNIKNDGNIGICLINNGNNSFGINKSDKIAQGIIEQYFITENDTPPTEERSGGHGSTGK